MSGGINVTAPSISVNISRVQSADSDVPLPRYETEGAAGMDVFANFGSARLRGGVTLMPGERKLIPTGFRLAIPRGFEVQVRPRSGLALKRGLTVANAPGTIDSDYRGQVGVILINLGRETFDINHGDRIAQIVLAPVSRMEWVETDHLDETERGAGGFGSTGISRRKVE